jgi:hypothetical protein
MTPLLLARRDLQEHALGQLAYVNHLHLAGGLELIAAVRLVIISLFKYLTSVLLHMQDVIFLLECQPYAADKHHSLRLIAKTGEVLRAKNARYNGASQEVLTMRVRGAGCDWDSKE